MKRTRITTYKLTRAEIKEAVIDYITMKRLVTGLRHNKVTVTMKAKRNAWSADTISIAVTVTDSETD